jgi:DNA helicase MCM8
MGPVKNFSEKDLAAIAKIRDFGDTFSLVVASMCPNIFGHEMVKAGMLLGLFGGTPRNGKSAPPALANGGAAGSAAGGDASSVSQRSAAGGSRAGISGSLAAPIDVDAGVAAVAPVDAPAFEKQSAKMHIRSDPHILVVGDPGMGKSQMLQALSALAPRGVYVCGNTTSTTGLTVVRSGPLGGDSDAAPPSCACPCLPAFLAT